MNFGFDPTALLGEMTAAAQAAGASAAAFFRPGDATRASISYKSGNSPVTEADYAADALLGRRLRALLPEAGLISEERADDPARLEKRIVFIVDPIDGTRAFMRGDPRWAVSVALVADGRPILGVLHLPALGLTFSAMRGGGATLNGSAIAASARATLEGARLAGPGPLLARLRGKGHRFEDVPRIPSLAFRLAEVARGDIDVALASVDACDWDIAAADLLVEEAGGALCDDKGERPVYNRADLRHRVLVAAPRRLLPPMISMLAALEPTP